MNLFSRVVDLSVDGFRHMTIGRTLWAVIIVKLIIIFGVLKLFFFPNYLGTHAEKGQEADFVAGEVMKKPSQ